jgi:hypothetical protein
MGVSRQRPGERTGSAENIFIVGIDATSLLRFGDGYFTTARNRANATDLDLSGFLNCQRMCV